MFGYLSNNFAQTLDLITVYGTLLSVKIKLAASPTPVIGSSFLFMSLGVQAVLEILSPWMARRARLMLLPWIVVLFLTSLGLHVVVIGDRVWLPGRVKPIRDVKAVVSYVRHAPHPMDRHDTLCAVRSSRGDSLTRFDNPADMASFLGVPLVVESV